jgi:hypothetical protein
MYTQYWYNVLQNVLTAECYIHKYYIHTYIGTAIAQWLRYCATNQKVAGSIPNGVMEFFIDINTSDLTMALGWTQPLTEISTRSISWGKCGRCVRLTTLPPSWAVVKKSGNINFLEQSGPLEDCNGTALPLPCLFYEKLIAEQCISPHKLSLPSPNLE